mmetsp:Transcript_94269/g.177372  ORF Transcript_94269/g.177372 Transcript_94269/m.177372 type:complete len:317 (-) Transcript_94269:634-1584(-)
MSCSSSQTACSKASNCSGLAAALPRLSLSWLALNWVCRASTSLQTAARMASAWLWMTSSSSRRKASAIVPAWLLMASSLSVLISLHTAACTASAWAFMASVCSLRRASAIAQASLLIASSCSERIASSSSRMPPKLSTTLWDMPCRRSWSSLSRSVRPSSSPSSCVCEALHSSRCAAMSASAACKAFLCSSCWPASSASKALLCSPRWSSRCALMLSTASSNIFLCSRRITSASLPTEPNFARIASLSASSWPLASSTALRFWQSSSTCFCCPPKSSRSFAIWPSQLSTRWASLATSWPSASALCKTDSEALTNHP